MSTAEIFDVGGQQAVRLPAEIHIDGRIVSVRREGKAVILEPVVAADSHPESWPEGFFDAIHIDDPKFVRPEQGPSTSNATAQSNDVEDVYISPGAYLRSMLAIAWSCFRHPFSTTEIDLATGKAIP
jgi:virulence-associated protein VagC